MERKAVVLLSGGMDSATCCYEAKAAGYAIYALTVNYGQRAQRELQAAQAVARAVGAVQHHLYPMDLTLWGGSALTDATIAVPTGGVDETSIPVTYVPARNTIFLSLALSWAEVLGAEAIYIGVNDLDIGINDFVFIGQNNFAFYFVFNFFNTGLQLFFCFRKSEWCVSAHHCNEIYLVAIFPERFD